MVIEFNYTVWKCRNVFPENIRKASKRYGNRAPAVFTIRKTDAEVSKRYLQGKVLLTERRI